MKFKSLLICIVGLFALSAAIYVIACVSHVQFDDSYTSYFRTDIPEKNNYYYSYLNHYNIHDQTSDKVRNIKEWSTYLGGKFTETDIEEMLYHLSADSLNTIYQQAGKNTKNNVIQHIAKRRDSNTLNYLLFAKSCEQQALTGEQWNYKPDPTHILDSLIKRGLELYRKPQAEFTRLRYAFQVVRMAYYAGYYDDCRNYYREMIEPLSKSKALAKLWALSFCAGAEYKEMDYAEAAYHFSLVFDRCPRYSDAAMTSFRWMAHKLDTAQVTFLCANNYEKAVVQAMAGFASFQPTLEPLQQVYDLCPAIPYIETLLIREISKIEDGLSSVYHWDSDSLEYDDALLHAQQLKGLCMRYAGLHEVQQPALWYTAAAYLAYLSGEYEQAALLGDIAENEQPTNKVMEQLLAIRLLTETSAPMDSIKEARILPSVQWLMTNRQSSSESQSFFNRTLGNYFGETLPDLYYASNDPVKAVLCASIARQYSDYPAIPVNTFLLLDKTTSVVQLEYMVQVMSQPAGERTPYDNFLYDNAGFKSDELLELIGTKYFRKLQFEKAADYFKQLSEASPLFHLEHNPFEELPIERKASGHIHQQEILSDSKLSFANEMAELQYRIQTAKKPVPEDLYRYATGLYQMTWYGNSWQLLRYAWSINDQNEKISQDAELRHYFKTATAREYFMRAFETSRDKDFKARCLFMASNCFQKEVPGYIYDYKKDSHSVGAYFVNNPYFKQLNQKYHKTDFYKDAITRCSYLSDFAQMYGGK